MKLKEIYDEMINISRNLGITIRRDSGNFKSGFCTINGEEYIILNKSNPMETLTNVLAGSLSPHADKMYIKPVIRDFIDKESSTPAKEANFSLEVKY